MSWNNAVLAYIHQHPHLANWPDSREVLGFFDAKLRTLLPTALPVHTCHAALGDPALAVPLGAAFTLLHMAASVLDDFQDQDTDNPWSAWTLDRILSSTLAMVFLSQSCLAQLDTGERVKREVIDGYAQGWLLASVGQNRPVQPDELVASYWRHALAKASIGFAVAAWSGARIATEEPRAHQAAKEFGMSLGTLLQIADDIQDFIAAPTAKSPSALSASLPVILASERREHLDHAALVHLIGQEHPRKDSEWAKSVYELVLSLGGLSKTLELGKVYEQKAVAALAVFEPDRTAPLIAYARSILPSFDA
ncbi:MAG: polyprenyl synthetase family protein [Anaerolineales bacterium]|nr:polyprenyl synthetase family protein [Anaerolineales bacterium]